MIMPPASRTWFFYFFSSGIFTMSSLIKLVPSSGAGVGCCTTQSHHQSGTFIDSARNKFHLMALGSWLQTSGELIFFFLYTHTPRINTWFCQKNSGFYMSLMLFRIVEHVVCCIQVNRARWRSPEACHASNTLLPLSTWHSTPPRTLHTLFDKTYPYIGDTHARFGTKVLIIMSLEVP